MTIRWLRLAVVLLLGSLSVGCGGGGGDAGGSWTNAGIEWSEPYSSENPRLEYRKSGTLVELRGVVNAGSVWVRSGQVIATLPEGCRPPPGEPCVLLCPTWGWPSGYPEGYVGTAGVFVRSDGTILIKTVQQADGEQQFLWLDGQSFSTVSGSDGWTNAGMAWVAPYTSGESSAYPSTLEFRKSGTTVRLRGFANAGGVPGVRAGQVVGTLPEGYRPPPPEVCFFLCPTWGWPSARPDGYVGTAGVLIFPDGRIVAHTVEPFDGEQQFLLFDGLIFDTVTDAGGWTDEGVAWNPPFTKAPPYPSTFQYRKAGDVVRLAGLANAGSTRVRAGQEVATLPEGCRQPPSSVAFLLCPTWGWPAGHPDGYIGTAGVYVLGGKVVVQTVLQFDGVQQFLAFDGRSFSTSE